MRATSLRRLLPPVLALAAGLLTALWPLVESGFAEIPGGLTRSWSATRWSTPTAS